MKKHLARTFPLFCLSALLCCSIYARAFNPRPEGQGYRYKDDGDIYYTEAVEVISAIEIMGGYRDGSFRPGEPLTRGMAAKIIANLSITSEDVSEAYQVYQTAKVDIPMPFSDVSQDNAFTKYIAYCSQQNLISGYADRTFKPHRNVTYNAFLKMLLCALGHDQYAEGYVGDDWGKRVENDARTSGLLMNLKDNIGEKYLINGSADIPREVAALFAFNLLQANQVQSSDGVVTPRVVNITVYDERTEKYTHIRDDGVRYANDAYKNQLVQFGEERFPNLRRTVQDGKALWEYKFYRDPKSEEYEWKTIGSYEDHSQFRSYNVILDRNDEDDTALNETITVTNGSLYGELPIPVSKMRNQTFEGWFTQAEGGQEITSASPVWLSESDAKVLYAHWTSLRHYVFFNVNGGVFLKREKDKMEIPPNSGDSIILSGLPTPAFKGYKFAGWYTDPKEGDRIKDGDKVSASASLTLYAHWTPAQYWVTFLASGMSVSTSRKSVTYGQVYGKFPNMDAKNGVPFAGWYTQPDGKGVRVKETDSVQEAEDHILYGHWSLGIDASACVLTFNVEDLEHEKLYVRPGAQLTQWPAEPEKESYDFTGWVESSSGKVPELPLTVTSNMLFNATYAVLQSCSVTFHAPGRGIVKLPQTLVVEPGTQLQAEDLPKLTTPEEDDYYFRGWSASPDRNLIVSVPLTVRSDLDLYAVWENAPSREDFAYQFRNNPDDFEYKFKGDGYETIPLERFQFLFGNDMLAKKIYGKYHFDSEYDWTGNCYGISTTAGMFQHPGNGVKISDLSADLSGNPDEPESHLTRPYDVKLPKLYKNTATGWDNLPLIEFIEAMQISQRTITFVRTYWNNFNSLKGMCGEVARVSEANGGAPVICMYQGLEGHALLGYYLVEYEKESRLYVYDSNFPTEDLYITLTKDENGNYVKWEYEKAREYVGKDEDEGEKEEQGGVLTPWGSQYGGYITYIPYETYYFIWQRRGNQDVSMNFLSTNLEDVTVKDGDGNRLASFRDGQIQDTGDIRRNSVYPLVELDENPDGQPRSVAVWLPGAGEYRIENNAPYGNMEQEISLSNAEQSVTIRTKARAVTLSADKFSAIVKGEDGKPLKGKDGKSLTETIVRLGGAVDGRAEDTEIEIEGVRLPESVSPYAAENASIVWRGSAASGAKLTLEISKIEQSVKRVSLGVPGVRTEILLVNGQDMTDDLNNAPNGVLTFNFDNE